MYTPQEFSIPELTNISKDNINEHLKLYQGYVKNTNSILKAIESGSVDGYALREMHRRLSFEYNGMKNHEYYFAQLEDGATDINLDSAFTTAINQAYGSFDDFIKHFKDVAGTRGVGWAILGYDKDQGSLITYWVDEQHLGHLNSVSFVYGIDMWEHAYVGDYWSSGKGSYINDYIDQTNWSVVEKRFALIVAGA